ncbi:AP-3 complex subunit delta-1-like isoform X2 [Paramacrobiotus metropolitanus]|uniref:AP-3 complex subunit delta-1-like isoform X2 n=1 Tax=Paramacrobiotus metropolitanus TaxID=2943436 RepID=UPI0024464766|nr:AP-3 complex subunit delta-1-like isoform X2 [Paramacrobiotus metropolitanus]
MDMALRKVKGNLERLFDKSLTDLVRGIRNNRDNEARYISQCLDEIKQELKQDNMAVKMNAIEKLTYLQMLGYDISWAAFNVIEVMSSTKFTCKRIGYLAASQSFSEDTEVLMLTTNMIRKDITSPNLYDASVALGGLACFISNDLARDLANDAMSLLTSSKPYIRKRAVLLLYKVFLKYPDALRPCFGRLKEKLEDPDPGVQSAAVNVICELARKHPKNYLALAPTFFKLMTNSTNNWMLIKIIKLFGALTPLEPRLGKKLIEPLTTLIHSTSAMSLLYECINTVIAVLLSMASGLPDHTSSIQLCVQKLRILIEDSDQNLKYLGLLAMSKILQAHPKSVLSLKDLILQCLDDRDESIRLRALDLLYGMVSKKTLIDIVKKLMDHMAKAEGSTYRDELLTKIIHICSQNNYQHVVDFEWYVSVLVDLTKMEGTHHGSQIATQLLDVAVRVPSIRHFTVQQMAILLENAHRLPLTAHGSTIHEVLLSAAWICGEFSEHLIDPRLTMEAMLKSKVISYPAHVQAVYVQNIGKLYSKVIAKAEAEDDYDTVKAVGQMLVDRLPMFVGSSDLEVQERASTLLQVVQALRKMAERGDRIAGAVQLLYSGELNPVAAQAQRKVPIPDGLNLEAWINEPVVAKESSEEESDEDLERVQSPKKMFKKVKKPPAHFDEIPEERQPSRPEPSEKELDELRQRRLQEQASNPNYLKASGKANQRRSSGSIFSSPETPSTEQTSGIIPGLTSSQEYIRKKKKSEEPVSKKSKKSKKKAKAESDEEEGGAVAHQVNRGAGEMPEGATWSDHEENANDPYKALDIDIQSPLRAEERLPIYVHRRVANQETSPMEKEEDPVGKERRKGKKEKEEKKSKKKDKDEKKTKRKKTEKVFENVTAEVSLLNIEDNEVPTPKPAELASVVHVEEKKDKDDMDFWLAQEPKSEVERPKSLTLKKTSSVDKEKRPKEKDGKKKKKLRSKTRSRSAEEELMDEVPEVVDKAGYEEAFGLEQEGTANSSPQDETTSLSRFITLVEDKNVKVEYDTYISNASSRQIAGNFVFTNKLADASLKNITFEVVDSVGLGIDRDAGMEMPVKFAQMLPKANWNVTLLFTLKADSATPQSLRGSISYLKVDATGTSVPEMKDFRFQLSCSSFMLPVQISNNEYALLLESGQLNTSSRNQVEVGKMNFSEVISRICFRGQFYLVEQVANSATLHTMSILQQRVAVLIKMGDERVTIEVKSPEQALTTQLLAETVAAVQ